MMSNMELAGFGVVYVMIGLAWYLFSLGVLEKRNDGALRNPLRAKILAALVFALAWPFVFIYGLGQVMGDKTP